MPEEKSKIKLKEKVLERIGLKDFTELEKSIIRVTIQETSKQIFDDIEKLENPYKKIGFKMILSENRFKELKKKWLKS